MIQVVKQSAVEACWKCDHHHCGAQESSRGTWSTFPFVSNFCSGEAPSDSTSRVSTTDSSSCSCYSYPLSSGGEDLPARSDSRRGDGCRKGRSDGSCWTDLVDGTVSGGVHGRREPSPSRRSVTSNRTKVEGSLTQSRSSVFHSRADSRVNGDRVKNQPPDTLNLLCPPL